MGSFTDYMENRVLDAMCGNGADIASTSMWVALYTAAPSDASGGTECTGGDYARVSSGAWASAAGGVVANVAAITFATATGTWGGTTTYFALLDDSATGHMIAWATLTSAREIATYDICAFAIGSLTITLT